jgi:hypothetical protein
MSNVLAWFVWVSTTESNLLLTQWQLARWQAVAAFDIITEAALFAVAAYMAQGLKTSVSKKSVVLVAFGLRLL